MLTTRSHRRAAAVLAATVVLCTPGCTHPRDFAATDLDELVAKPDEAPPSLVYSQTLSGPVDLEVLGGDDVDVAALERTGCQDAYAGIFGTVDLLDYLVRGEPNERPPKSHGLVTTAAVLCGTPQRAGDALAVLRRDATERIASDRLIPSREFGDGSFAVAGIDDTGRSTILYGWRERNVYQSVESHGAIDPSDILFIARNMQRRAEALR